MAEQRGVPPSIKMDDTVYGSIIRPVDSIGRPQPHILGAFGILKVAMQAGLPAPVEVPSEFWTQDVGERGFTVAVVSCPCGSTPSVEVGCLSHCECERYFYFAVDRVVAYNSPKAADAPPNPELQSEA